MSDSKVPMDHFKKFPASPQINPVVSCKSSVSSKNLSNTADRKTDKLRHNDVRQLTCAQPAINQNTTRPNTFQYILFLVSFVSSLFLINRVNVVINHIISIILLISCS